MATAFQVSAFQINAFQILPADTGDVGGRIAGGQFSKGKWREVKERRARERQEYEYKRRLKADDRAARRLRARNLAQERADAQSIEALRLANEQLLARLGLQNQLAAGHTAAVHALNQAMAFAAQNLAIAQRLEREEEEEAVELLSMDDD